MVGRPRGSAWLASTTVLGKEVRELTDACPCPVLFAGGPLRADPDDAYRTAADAIQGGAAGLVFSRNIFQQPDPAAALAKFSSIVHGREVREQRSGDE